MSAIVDYQGKTVVVTGAATGVGAALVARLRDAGAARIIALDIKPCSDSVDDYVAVDLSDPQSVDQAMTRLPDSIDALFNNAGVAATLPLPVVMGVNVLAPRRLIDGLVGRMAPGSAVVITASTAGGGFMERLSPILELLALDDWDQALQWIESHPDFTNNPYGFSKECAQVVTLQRAAVLGAKGIRINSVCPGLIETPLITDFEKSQGLPILDWMTSQSGGRKASAQEVADAIAFLGSSAASYINGTNLLVDNGFSASILTNQIDYSGMPTVDALLNAST